jgi:hypothetical protein
VSLNQEDIKNLSCGFLKGFNTKSNRLNILFTASILAFASVRDCSGNPFLLFLPWARSKCKKAKKIAAKSPTPHFSCGGTPKK